ncbi:MAG: lipid-binding SYLF domain-containing protein [Burkholderiaceae bacterium]
MNITYFHRRMVAATAYLAFFGVAIPCTALAANPAAAPSQAVAANQAYTASDTVEQVNEAKAVVEKMTSDPDLKRLLEQARGVFIVPTYGRGGWGIGIRGGEGVMLTQSGHKWSNPVFYNLGGISIGFQGGAEAGSLAMLLMTDKAVQQFMTENNFSINAGAGLTLVNYTGKAQAGAGHGDVIVWADTKGAFANATVGATDIRLDQSDTQAFYKRTATAKEILNGAVTSPQASALKQALPTGS